MSRYDEIEVGGSPMAIFLAAPEGPRPHPAVLLMCHGAGIDEFTRDVAERLAAAGYVAGAPDIFHRQPGIEDPVEKRANLKDSEIAADIDATVARLEGMADVQAGNLSILGHCMGGRMAFLGASLNPIFRAAVIYYGGNIFVSWGNEGPTPFERLKDIKCPVIGFFGMDDANPSPEDVNKIDAALEEHGIAHEFHRYAGAGHAFQNFTRADAYREEATKDSWQRTLDFLQQRLG
ncbi:MAG: dienelactone hydrolase family protein [Alphaproteobacteria bacterium]